MVKIILIRHGETDWNCLNRINGLTDIPLNENGVRQAQKTADYLKTLNLDNTELWSSPLRRAKVTANIIGKVLNIETESKIELIERDFGDLEGKVIADVNWEEDSQLMESYIDLFKRIEVVIEEIKEKEDKTIIIVTHASIIRHFIYLLIGLNKKIDPTNCSITSILTDGFDTKIDDPYYNFNQHLT